MFAELVINIEAGLEGTFHYDVPSDLRAVVQIGHLVEIEFGRRLAQGIIVDFSERAPVENTKPIIALVDEAPVAQPSQIELARWMSGEYLTPLNACLRLFLPPGLTRWSDVTVEINPYWDGTEKRLTETQKTLIELLRKNGDMRGKQIRRAMPKTEWKTAVNQLAKRKILLKASVLDPPRIRPKKIRAAQLIMEPQKAETAALQLGRRSKAADILLYLLNSDDPLPEETAVLQATSAAKSHLKKLIASTLVRREPKTSQLKVPNSLFIISLAVPPLEAHRAIFRLRGAEKYYQIIHLLAEESTAVPVSQLYAETGANIGHLRKLVKLDAIRLTAEEVWRDPLADHDFTPAQAPLLTADQARVWGRVKAAMMDMEMENGEWRMENEERLPLVTRHSQPAFLLHGVTGSGKTEIYMRAIEYALLQGQQAIVLVPEIALTPQTVRRFAARFPGRVAVLHSRLSDGERYDTWRRARQGLIDIIVGPRSALFSPLPNLGVIALDEEHDPSYKQTPPVPAPYYHARETAVQLGKITGATVIMGSATPDVVAYHQARAGQYRLLELPKRVMGHRQRVERQAARLQIISHYRNEGDDPDDALTIPLPPVQIVDLRQELRAGNRSIFSRALEKAITETLERKEQAILFLNRRGTSSFVICRDCGYIAKCPRCDTPLTYHRPGMALVCHHCGRREQPHPACPDCGSKRIRYFGLGTEQVEDLVQQRWPDARITRWDSDTTAGKNSHGELLARFMRRESDILVGTQMIAKGLDLPLVTLVGVISADVSLGLPDFRAGERAFQVLAQVAGRAGRGLRGGRVIIQTYKPEHYAIQAAADHDFIGFYLDEIRFRTQHGLPPFRRMAKLLIVDPLNDRAQREAARLAAGLRAHVREKALAATEIIGPTPPFFSRIGGRYRWQIIIRSPNPLRLLEGFTIPRPWIVDIDPVSVL